MKQVVVGLKVDVDTLVGYQKGVPALLEQFAGAGVRASFFFSVGPDRSGLAIRRVFTQRGFLGKMLRNRALSTFGWRTVLSGTLLPAPLILASEPGLVRRVAEAGHEVGVHAWDHVSWHDKLAKWPAEKVASELDKAFRALEAALGEPVTCFAAPGWQCSPVSLALHDKRKLRFASDVRGPAGPFRPQIADQVFQTPHLATSLPTLDELWGERAATCYAVADYWLQALEPGVNVLTVHAEMEGLALPETLPYFFAKARERGIEFKQLGALIEGCQPDVLPTWKIAPDRLPGRAGKVWCVQRESK